MISLVTAACTGPAAGEGTRITVSESSRCLGYLRDLAFMVRAMDPLVVEGERQIDEAVRGSDTDRSAEVLGNIATSFAKLGRDLDGLGSPPDQLAEAAELMDQSLERLALAHEVAAEAAGRGDAQELAAVRRTVDEGVALAVEASEAATGC